MNAITLLVLDVDGVLTSGQVVPGPEGDAVKSFNVRDGHALKLWQRCEGTIAILSARTSKVVGLRAAELGIRHVYQGVADKVGSLQQVLTDTRTASLDAMAYVGDDLPDVPVMRRSGVAIAVGDAAPEAKRAAHLVTRCPGGQGAVAEAVEWLLRKQGRWSRERLYSL